MEKHGSINGPFNWSIRFGHACLIVFALLQISCASSSRPTVCGVPVQGSPWQLAASIHDNGDGTFVPQCVELTTATKAYISGWLMPEEQRAQIVCDVEDGKVTNAILHTENDK